MSLISPSGSTSLQLGGGDNVTFFPLGGLSGATSFTLEVWVNPSSEMTMSGIHQVLSLKSSEFTMVIKLNAGLAVLEATDINGGTINVEGTTIPAGVWTYLAASYNLNDRSLTIYVGGLIAGSTLFDHDLPVDPTGSYMVVAGDPASTVADQGYIGRVAVWGTARTDDDVLVDGSQSSIQSPVAQPILSLYVDFANLPAVDQSGYGNSIAYSANANICFSVPGVLLNGNAYIDVGTGSNLDYSGSQSFTIDGWVYPTGVGAVVARADQTTTEYLVEVVSVADGVAFQFIRGGASVISAAISLNQWSYFSAVYDGIFNTLFLYVDGNLHRVLSPTTVAVLPSAAASTLIGASGPPGAVGQFFSGQVQFIRLWSEALTQGAIRQWAFNQAVTDPTLSGSFDFSVVPSNDTTSLNPINYHGDVAINLLSTTYSPDDTAAIVGNLSVFNETYLGQNPQAPPEPPAELTVAAQPAPWSAAHREAYLRDILQGLRPGTSAERRAVIELRFDKAYTEAERIWRANPSLKNVFSKTRRHGVEETVYHGPAGDVVLSMPPLASSCQTWWIQFCIALSVGFINVVTGLYARLTPAAINRIADLIMSNQKLVAAIGTALAVEFTASTAMQLAGATQAAGVFWPVLRMMRDFIGWWALGKVLVQIIAFLTGEEAAMLLARFIIWSVQLAILAEGYHGACGSAATRDGCSTCGA